MVSVSLVLIVFIIYIYNANLLFNVQSTSMFSERFRALIKHSLYTFLSFRLFIFLKISRYWNLFFHMKGLTWSLRVLEIVWINISNPVFIFIWPLSCPFNGNNSSWIFSMLFQWFLVRRTKNTERYGCSYLLRCTRYWEKAQSIQLINA